MTKTAWKRHWEQVKFDSRHDFKMCLDCQARLRTKKANERARAIRAVYRDLGMKRVKGSLGGIYYE